MRPPRAVIDTNVVVSGVLTRLEASPTVRILEAMLRARFRYLLSLDLIAEYRAVLWRPRIRSRHGLSSSEVDTIVTDIVVNGAVLPDEATTAARAPRGDEHLWTLLSSDGSAVLVTGDRRLFARKEFAGRVILPRDFMDLLDA